MDTQLIGVIFLFGLCIGSFLNVCIYRLPLSRSIVTPPSACPRCGHRIRFHENIPVISYLVLRGKCSQCKAPIPIRYPIVECLSGLFAVCVYLKTGLSPAALVYYAFICALMVITFIDIDHQIIPDRISLPGIPLFFIGALAVPQMTWKSSLLGILIGGGSLFAVAWIYQALRKREGMGGGDIKLLAMIGALIGMEGVLFTIFVGSALGTLAGIADMIRSKKDMKLAIPFGPFLSLGAILYIFYGPEIIYWYFNLLR